ncbi:glycerol-3-phosphate dehydrogenase/oxidase [Moritella marina ATCC 15381]|uniref:Glycerol-3-phosphate dehydrogenase/oxidase n=1 Tax=Moritella marina ATCC 15381 TaxID=1202962 RepID=A0A5J6WP16_MORMI|nr:glycerol-3-phosphate dehydrogenase/oxidase [Moritella marina]QFI39909.1 glycerol-3-phosphate dehydrogenase/oxidase [Moritella marina ATCC 15381]
MYQPLTSLTRDQQLEKLQLNSNNTIWDMIVVGGGITGAGILLTASQAGLKVLLIEKQDFAWGASSKSSKMVHGGLRYLGSGQYTMTKDAVTEREKLLNELPGLVNPLQFLMGHYKYQFPGPFIFNSLLTIYDWIGGKRNHRYINNGIADFHVPGIEQHQLRGATQFADAVTDDARLVMRVLQEAQELGGTVMNYLSADILLKQELKTEPKTTEQVTGIRVEDQVSGQQFNLTAKVVINATGPWTDKLRQQLQAKKAIRPLRGSHLIVPSWRLPLAYSVSYFHPEDKRPIFAFPWENSTVIGTTDLDHDDLEQQPCISQNEVDYLLSGINKQFPQAELSEADVISTYAGIRPVVSNNASENSKNDVKKTKPSDEKREHSIWNEQGLISVAGGKLTTFRLIALDVLKVAQHYLPDMNLVDLQTAKLFTAITVTPPTDSYLNQQQIQRLKSHYGSHYSHLLNHARHDELKLIGSTNTSLAELKWILQHEMVVHLDDLLLRRSRIGLLLPKGGEQLFTQLQHLCQTILEWDDQHWQHELARYQDIIQRYYGLPQQRFDIATFSDDLPRVVAH